MTIAASFEQSFGYGFFTTSIVRHLISVNVDVQLVPLFGHHVPPDLVPFCVKSQPKNIDLIIVSMPQLPSAPKAKALFTMWESSEIPLCYAPDLKKFKHIITPTEWSAAAIRPHHPRNIHFCPLGVNMKWSAPVLSPFTFTVVAADHMAPERKRVQDIVDTFSDTFKSESDVRLLIKRNPECRPLRTFDNRVEIIKDRVPRNIYDALIARTTVGVQLCAAEGWSLPVNEFMAAGKPVICPLAGSIGDYVSPKAVFPIGYTMRKAPPSVYLGVGKVPHADTRDLSAQMRFCYENPFEVVRRGVQAFETSQKYSAHAMGANFLKLWQSLS